jgi:chemotaxis protein histidine kinase CheA
VNTARYAELFRAESRERLAEMNTSLLALERGEGADRVAELFRAVHTVKGMSAAMGYADVRDLSHSLEALLDQLRRGALEQDLSWVENSAGRHTLITFVHDKKSAKTDKIVTLSGLGGGNTNQQAAHTERKVAGSIDLEEGDEVTMFGREDPCASCQGALAHWLFEQGGRSKTQTVFKVDYYATKTNTKWTITYDKSKSTWTPASSSYKTYDMKYTPLQKAAGHFIHQ